MLLSDLSPEEFEAELTARIDRAQRAYDALGSTFVTGLAKASIPSQPLSVHKALFGEVAASERALEEAWAKMERRKG